MKTKHHQNLSFSSINKPLYITILRVVSILKTLIIAAFKTILYFLLLIFRNLAILGTLAIAYLTFMQAKQDELIIANQSAQLEIIEKEYREAYRPLAHLIQSHTSAVPSASNSDSIIVAYSHEFQNRGRGPLIFFGGLCYYSHGENPHFKNDLFNNNIEIDNMIFDTMNIMERGRAYIDSTQHALRMYETFTIDKGYIDLYIYPLLLYKDQASDYWYGTIGAYQYKVSKLIDSISEMYSIPGKEEYFIFTSNEIEQLISIIQQMATIRGLETHNLIDHLLN